MIRRNLKDQTRKDKQLKFYNVMALQILLYGRESRTVGKRDLKRLEAAEMRFLRGMMGCKLHDHILNTEIRDKVNIEEET